MGCCETPKYIFSASLWGLVGADWKKSDLNLRIPPKSVVLAPLDPPPKEVSIFLVIIAKVRSLQIFFT